MSASESAARAISSGERWRSGSTQPSGEITARHECSSISSALTASTRAPPLPPSPITTGDDRHRQSGELRDAAGDRLRDAALLALRAGKRALRVDEGQQPESRAPDETRGAPSEQPSGRGMPKLRCTFSAVPRRAGARRPPARARRAASSHATIIAASSPNERSPCTSTKSVQRAAT